MFQENQQLEVQFKINNIKKFLEERSTINEINDNFLSVFVSPRDVFSNIQSQDKMMEKSQDTSSNNNNNQ